jgi:magnesium transporter
MGLGARNILPRTVGAIQRNPLELKNLFSTTRTSTQCSVRIRTATSRPTTPRPYLLTLRRNLHWWKQQNNTGTTSSSKTTSSNTKTSSPPPRNGTIEDQSPSFKVAKVSYRTGDIRTVNLHTSELLKSASIYARDLFTLNLTSRQERRRKGPVRRTLSAILPRKDLIVLSFGNVRAVASLDYVFLFDAHNPLVQDFAQGLSACYKANASAAAAAAAEAADHDGGIGGDHQHQHEQHLFQQELKSIQQNEPNELVFLEQVLADAADGYNRRLRLFEPIVDSFLDRVANEVYSDTGVHQLVPLKDSLQSFEIQVKQSLDCLTGLLNSDDDMLDLLLTEQAEAELTGGQVDYSRHEYVELLLGVYARQLSNIVMEISYLLQRLQSKQEFVALALSGYRNRMIRMNVHLGIATLSLGLGTTVAGLFGMNLINGLEQHPMAFTYIVLGSGTASMVIALGSLNYLSGHNMQMRAAQRMEEIETLSGALSDMCALDYVYKNTVEVGVSVDKAQFRRILTKARQSKKVTPKEVDLLFEVLDRVKDGELNNEDLKEYETFSPSGALKGKR